MKKKKQKLEEETIKNLIEFCDNRITESGIKIGHYANLKKMYQEMLDNLADK